MSRIDRHDRETFIAALLKAVPTATRAHALRLLRWGATYLRLSEAKCNGDWPTDNGSDGITCHAASQDGSPNIGCGLVWRGGLVRGLCPSCRAERIIRETCESMGSREWMDDAFPADATKLALWVRADFQGDPRGHTVRLQIAGAPLDAYERAALAIPTS